MSLFFQYCPKIAVFHEDAVLACRRKGEADYNGVFSLIGGKMEHSDASIEAALRREKNEEVGRAFKIRLLPRFTIDTHFVKNDGNHMILPHFYAEFVSGEIRLSEEYSEARWVPLDELDHVVNIIENLRWIVPALKSIGVGQPPGVFVDI